MKKSYVALIGFVVVNACIVTLHAQTAGIGSFNNVTPAQPAASDSLVQIAADMAGLERISPGAVSPGSTYWLALPGGHFAPLPALPDEPGTVVFAIADGQYLVDSGNNAPLPRAPHGRQLSASDTVKAGLADESSALANLIGQIQGAQVVQPMMMASGLDLPSPDGSYSDYSFDTNLLYLSLTNVSAGLADVNLHNATGQVYAIWSTTNLALAFTNWLVEMEVWPTETNCMPFTLPTQGRDTLFLRAEDWTSLDSDGDGIPDWWTWLYWGTTTVPATAGNLDYSGSSNTFGIDYSNNIAPTVFQFNGIMASNNYVKSSLAPVQLDVAGNPYYIAALIDDTNFNDAVWNVYYSSNVTMNLGSQPGWHGVWLGLRGHGDAASAAVWRWKHLNLAPTPLLVITNPTSNAVSQPVIQLYGYCQEPLASICYDLSNAVGVATSQPAEITDQHYDPNTGGFTTNYFECLDVPLANGLNIVTIHATDLAGNSAATNFNFTLDYSNKTNPPTFQILWPQWGTQIGGSNFTCHGALDDPTATVAVQLVFTNSSTNIFYGGIYTNTYVASIERNGTFWLENLPLNPGTNSFVIQVTDAVGNSSTTNLVVVQSPLVLMVDPVTPDSRLWQPTVSLTGTISAVDFAVWVNGVKGHNNGKGTWQATNVPVNADGAANFTITAYAPSEQQPDGSYGNN